MKEYLVELNFTALANDPVIKRAMVEAVLQDKSNRNHPSKQIVYRAYISKEKLESLIAIENQPQLKKENSGAAHSYE